MVNTQYNQRRVLWCFESICPARAVQRFDSDQSRNPPLVILPSVINKFAQQVYYRLSKYFYHLLLVFV